MWAYAIGRKRYPDEIIENSSGKEVDSTTSINNN
jgi:hypothetical protein